MKTPRFFALTLALVLIAAGGFICDPSSGDSGDDEEDKCGEKMNRNLFPEGHGLATSAYMKDENTRCYGFSGEVTDVCTFEHSEARFYFTSWVSPTYAWVEEVEVWYGFGFYSIPVEMESSRDTSSPTDEEPWEWRGSAEFGLKHYYGDGPGDFNVRMSVCFPTQGSFAEDDLYYEEIEGDPSIYIRAKRHKGD